ncbi:MAG: creatinine amidohydrolase [Mariniblastus sp.]|jgi:creatinine amidohydrolase
MNLPPPRPYVLAETNWKTVQDTDYTVAVLPWGATEAHNYHLPYATDNLQVEHVAIEAARQAWAVGAKTAVLPCIPFGVNTGQMNIKLCVNMSPSTQFGVLQDVATVVEEAGIEKLVIVNGHGGNHFKQMLRELSMTHPALFACSVNWFEAADAFAYFEEPGNHAGDLETSCIMHIAPQWVRPLAEAGDGAAKSFKIEALKQGWASAQRAWTQVTADTGVGNPAAATPEKGQKFLDATSKNFGKFLVELASADLDDMYE